MMFSASNDLVKNGVVARHIAAPFFSLRREFGMNNTDMETAHAEGLFVDVAKSKGAWSRK